MDLRSTLAQLRGAEAGPEAAVRKLVGVASSPQDEGTHRG